MRRIRLQAAGIPVLLASLCALASPASAQDVAGKSTGAMLFESRCLACHSLDGNRVGPMLRGVVGRKVASVADYAYSDALKRVSGRWSARRLQAWLQDPQSVAPGTKMAFSLPSAADRDAVIQYLAAQGSPPGAKKALRPPP